MSMDEWPRMRLMLGQQLKLRTAGEWEQLFQQYDTCMTEIQAPFIKVGVQPLCSPLRAKL